MVSGRRAFDGRKRHAGPHHRRCRPVHGPPRRAGVRRRHVARPGSGGWEIACTFQTENGERFVRARGRGLNDFDQIAAANAVSGECAYAGEDGAFVTVRSQEAQGFAGPFVAEADISTPARRASASSGVKAEVC